MLFLKWLLFIVDCNYIYIRTNAYGGMPSRPSGGPFGRHFFNGLDTIPEYQVTDPPSTFQVRNFIPENAEKTGRSPTYLAICFF